MIPGLNRFFTGLATSIRTTFFPEDALKALKTSAKGWTTAVTRPITALGGPKGGGGIIARVGRVFSGIGNAIRGIFTDDKDSKELDLIKVITIYLASSIPITLYPTHITFISSCSKP